VFTRTAQISIGNACDPMPLVTGGYRAPPLNKFTHHHREGGSPHPPCCERRKRPVFTRTAQISIGNAYYPMPLVTGGYRAPPCHGLLGTPGSPQYSRQAAVGGDADPPILPPAQIPSTSRNFSIEITNY
jgi:hypothetical protein